VTNAVNSYQPDIYKYAAFFVLYEVSTYLANDMIMPGMIHVVHEFNVSVSYAATSLSYFILGGCTLPLWLSFLGVKLGLRKVLLFGNSFFLLTTLLIPFCQTIHQFLLMRFLQGMGLGFIFIGYATVHSLFDDVAAIKLIALLGNISLMAPLVGPLLGGLITNHYNWRFVFILVGVLSLISLVGLKRYMPILTPTASANSSGLLLQQYKNLLSSKIFVSGTLINSLNGIVTISWIGLSPVIILETYHEEFANYAGYQLLVFSGTTISSILLQFIVEPRVLPKLIRLGANLAVGGLTFSLVFSFFSHLACVLGIFLFTLGAGLYMGIVNRMVIRSFQDSSSPIAALNSIIYAIISVLGLEACNFVCNVIGYTLPAWALTNMLLAGVIKSLINYFLKLTTPGH
jgi:DHA1 family multidrug/chloramphenicol efflux transport protein-like MFS transporter